jgi:hypothetical protein
MHQLDFAPVELGGHKTMGTIWKFVKSGRFIVGNIPIIHICGFYLDFFVREMQVEFMNGETHTKNYVLLVVKNHFPYFIAIPQLSTNSLILFFIFIF